MLYGPCLKRHAMLSVIVGAMVFSSINSFAVEIDPLPPSFSISDPINSNPSAAGTLPREGRTSEPSLMPALPVVDEEKPRTSSVGEIDHSQHNTGLGAHLHHTHQLGDWMFEYRTKASIHEGILDKSTQVLTTSLVGTNLPYSYAPTKMTRTTHMVMGMYGFSNTISLMGMMHIVQNNMSMVRHDLTQDINLQMSTQGLGDTFLGVMYRPMSFAMFNLIVSVPSGAVNKEVTVNQSKFVGPYAMQLGTGTYDFMPSASISYKLGAIGINAEAMYTYHLGKNNQDWALGDEIKASTWISYSPLKSITANVRLDVNQWAKIEDTAPGMTSMSPNYDPKNTGGMNTNIFFNVSGMFSGVMAGFEWGMPIYQNFKGPQLKTKQQMTLSLQYMF
ncbi:MAG: hypothetical protein OEZ58_05920 [Gammaproteobacteria bacterium]|nr:hypothetical protein [Gammaproteobacteria bacterium]